MIVKKIKNPRRSTSKLTRLSALIDYIEDELTPDGQKEKTVYRNARNFLSDDPTIQKEEMAGLIQASQRSQNPLCHYVLSWQTGEQPTPEQIEQAVDVLLDELKMPDHQVIYALHRDTEHAHLHVVVNKINPATEKSVSVYNDVHACHRAIARIEQMQGWNREPNHLYDVNENGQAVKRDVTKEPVKDPSRPTRQKADQHEQRNGTKSAERIAKEAAVPLIKSAKSWQELHESLAANGFKYERKGSGALLYVNDQPIKASTADRSCSLSSLEKRLGTYEPPNPSIEVRKRPAVELLPSTSKASWQQYTDEKKRLYDAKQQALKELRQRHAAERQAFQKQWSDEYAGLYKHDWRGHGAALNAMRSVLAARKAMARLEMKDRHAQERKALFEAYELIPDFKAWRRKKDREQEYAITPVNPVVIGSSQPPKHDDLRDFLHRINANNKVEYYRPAENKPSFIDVGEKIVIGDTKQDSVLAALQLAQGKWPTGFTVTGDDAFKQECVKLAVTHNLKLTNPELQDAIKAERMKLQEQERLLNDIKKAVVNRDSGVKYGIAKWGDKGSAWLAYDEQARAVIDQFSRMKPEDREPAMKAYVRQLNVDEMKGLRQSLDRTMGKDLQL